MQNICNEDRHTQKKKKKPTASTLEVIRLFHNFEVAGWSFAGSYLTLVNPSNTVNIPVSNILQSGS